MNNPDFNKYRDMLLLPHPVSKKHPLMPLADRAAQFSPFAALTGYDAAVAETARLTDRQVQLSEQQRNLLDSKLSLLQQQLAQKPEISVTYFVKDERKEGGRYETVTGNLRRIDRFAGNLQFTDGTAINFQLIYSIDSAELTTMLQSYDDSI